MNDTVEAFARIGFALAHAPAGEKKATTKALQTVLRHLGAFKGRRFDTEIEALFFSIGATKVIVQTYATEDRIDDVLNLLERHFEEDARRKAQVA